MDGVSAKSLPAASKDSGGKTANLRDKGAALAQHLEALKPKVLAAFENDNVSILPRPELAVRIGHIVTVETDADSHNLNLLDRRNLVADLIRWLVHCSPKAAPKTAPKKTSAEASLPAATAKEPAPAEDTLAPTRDTKKTAKPAVSKTAESTKVRIEPLVMDRLDVSAASKLPRAEMAIQLRDIVNEVLAEEKIRLNGAEQQAVVELLLDDMLGLGPLEPLLADEGITDILINGSDMVYIERRGKLELSNVTFRDNDHVLNIARRIVSVIGRRVDETVPLVDARLQDGSRVNIIIPPLAIDGPSISIRKFSKKSITLDVMKQQNNISEQMATVLKIAARSRLNILISGGTGSGKTTLLNALSQLIDERERIVTIEDAAELQLQQPHVVRLETRPANLEGTGEINMRDLVKNSLRMRPDRIILGEVRGAEAVDMLQAMNTGHDGSLGTVHANRPREALTRLENMVGMAGINLPAKAVRTQIAAALDMIVQVSRMRDGMRRITHITEVIGMEGDIITTQDLFTYEFEGEGLDGMLKGHFRSSGLRPNFAPKASYFGLDRRLLECM
ncbi:MAG TPA: ATPase, T2SS/T4P/T4SS family [Kiloniellales bacterium]